MNGELIINVKNASTEELKEAWDNWNGFDNIYGFVGEEIHLELNLRGEGVYCAI